MSSTAAKGAVQNCYDRRTCANNRCVICPPQVAACLDVVHSPASDRTLSMINDAVKELMELQVEYRQHATKAVQSLRMVTPQQLTEMVKEAFPKLLSPEQLCDAFDSSSPRRPPSGLEKEVKEGLYYHNLFSHNQQHLHGKVAELLIGRYKFNPPSWVSRDHANIQIGWELRAFTLQNAQDTFVVELSEAAFGKVHTVKSVAVAMHERNMFTLERMMCIVQRQTLILKGSISLACSLIECGTGTSTTVDLPPTEQLVRNTKAPNSWTLALQNGRRSLKSHLKSSHKALSDLCTVPGLLRSKVSSVVDWLSRQRDDIKSPRQCTLGKLLAVKYEMLPIQYALLDDLEILLKKVEAGAESLEDVIEQWERVENSCCWAVRVISRRLITTLAYKPESHLNSVELEDPSKMLLWESQKWQNLRRSEEPEVWFVARMQLNDNPLKDVIALFIEFQEKDPVCNPVLVEGFLEVLKAVQDVLVAIEVITPIPGFRGCVGRIQNPAIRQWMWADMEDKVTTALIRGLPWLRETSFDDKLEKENLQRIQNKSQEIVMRCWSDSKIEPALLTKLQAMLCTPGSNQEQKKTQTSGDRPTDVQVSVGRRKLSRSPRKTRSSLGKLASPVGKPTQKANSMPEPTGDEQTPLGEEKSRKVWEPFNFSMTVPRRAESQFGEDLSARSIPKEKTRGTPDPTRTEQIDVPEDLDTPAPGKLLFTNMQLFDIWTQIFPAAGEGTRRGDVLWEDLRRVLKAEPLSFKEGVGNDKVTHTYHRSSKDGHEGGNLVVHAPHRGRWVKKNIVDVIRADLRKEFGWTAETFGMRTE